MFVFPIDSSDCKRPGWEGADAYWLLGSIRPTGRAATVTVTGPITNLDSDHSVAPTSSTRACSGCSGAWEAQADEGAAPAQDRRTLRTRPARSSESSVRMWTAKEIQEHDSEVTVCCALPWISLARSRRAWPLFGPIDVGTQGQNSGSVTLCVQPWRLNLASNFCSSI